MQNIEIFIESDMFFPVLITVLVVLIGIFIAVLLSGDNKKKKKKINKPKIDSSQELKIIANETGEEIELVKDNLININALEEDLPSMTIESIPEEQNQITEVVSEKIEEEMSISEEQSLQNISLEKDEEINIEANPFEQQPIDNFKVEEEYVIEEPEENVSQKTEIFDFSELQAMENIDVVKEDEIDPKIIEEANRYIEYIMAKDR